ncbi:hypothetical protein F2Q70_00036227 [Brassica cretica]|uniref:Uncharacterized protein n=1 Tax=Brassica cretica TaxID=69181 RepID=A0A8S9JSR3_BRACR|nr:hypothetical protein F2Q70_00036227 [Brassica cretica]
MSSEVYYRSWMDKPHLDPNTNLLTEEYVQGIGEFMRLVQQQPDAKSASVASTNGAITTPDWFTRTLNPIPPWIYKWPTSYTGAGDCYGKKVKERDGGDENLWRNLVFLEG